MARKKKTKLSPEIKQSIFGIVFLLLGILTLIVDEKSIIGGYYIDSLDYLFGFYFKYIFSPVLIIFSIFLFKEKNINFDLYRSIGFLIYFVSIVTLIGYFDLRYIAFFNLYPIINTSLGDTSVLFIAILLFIFSLIILFRFSPFKFTTLCISLLGNLIKNLKNDSKYIKDDYNKSRNKIKDNIIESKKEKYDKIISELQQEKRNLAKKVNKNQLGLDDAPKKIKVEKNVGIGSLFKKSNKQLIKKEVKLDNNKVLSNKNFSDWELPKLDLLDNRGGDIIYDKNEIRRKEIEIQEKLLQFKIEVEMAGYEVGPTVIQFRLKPKAGVALKKIISLKKDLTLALKAKNIRIQAPIPGLGVVGIEVPNTKRQPVGLKEVLSSNEFNNRKLNIPLALGKDVSGNIIVGDLTKMPHLLIAGQTGSGKSVGMNGFLISMLYNFSPSELKFIMIDPKRVELSVYDGIPHLLTPVITSPDKALNSLKWCVAEMLRRYDLSVKAKARNLDEYNKKVKKSERLPYICIVVDELADLMMSGNKKEVESSIARIAQMARAVGMHLIVATQRPSVDVITGTIKANIPSRVAFTVSSQIDSQTIIGNKGAEDLLGRGDMLYYPTGFLEAERVQGVLVETEEVEAVVNKIKLTIDPDMLENMQDNTIVDGVSKTVGSVLEGYQGDQDESPEMIEKAIKVIKQAKKGSTSLIQRKLGVGYARAAKILDILEDIGVVGPSNGSKPREVYVD